MYKVLVMLGVLVCAPIVFAEPQTGCWFHRVDAPDVATPSDLKSVVLNQYFRIYYSPSDPMFADAVGNAIPELIQKQSAVFEKSRYLIERELGWKLPVSRSEAGQSELDVYFIQSGRRFGGTVRQQPALAIVMNRRALLSPDFAALWIHQLAHAVELQYRLSGDYWFFEATAGWFEGQFQGYSQAAVKAQQMRLAHPEISLADGDIVQALGASRFLDIVARSNRDVLRQTWDQWSYAHDLRADEVLGSVLALNHMPDLESYLQNYFLLSTSARTLNADSHDVTLAPFSAAVFEGVPAQNSGGIRLTFVPEGEDHYATALVFYVQGETSGTLALKRGLSGPSSLLLPYAGMDHFRFLIVNAQASWLNGQVTTAYDAEIPGVLEYFRVNNEDGGVQIEWKTSREDGVAFWNLYRVEGGKKELLNDFPIPATVQSREG
ncbi:MAG TPA: hypothetical protein VLR94_08165, partial [Acidobacteriota bacterium]|nr:hypothetical protein [Acidobacteriota bacterium]